jgi:hypothetical protein
MNIKRQILTLTIAAIASGTVLAQSEEYVVVTDEQGNREEIGVPA